MMSRAGNKKPLALLPTALPPTHLGAVVQGDGLDARQYNVLGCTREEQEKGHGDAPTAADCSSSRLQQQRRRRRRGGGGCRCRGSRTKRRCCSFPNADDQKACSPASPARQPTHQHVVFRMVRREQFSAPTVQRLAHPLPRPARPARRSAHWRWPCAASTPCRTPPAVGGRRAVWGRQRETRVGACASRAAAAWARGGGPPCAASFLARPPAGPVPGSSCPHLA